MKRIAIVGIAFFAAVQLNAQDYDLGVKGGVNYTQATILNVIGMDGVDMDDVESETGMGLVLGGFARATFGKLILQPELLFSEDQASVKLEDASIDNADLGDLFSMQVDKVDIPLLVGYKAFGSVRLMGGPVLSNIKGEASDPLFDFQNLSVGYQAGFGFDVNRMTFDARYEGNLSRFEDYIETDGGVIQVDSRRNIFQFTVGYKLFD